MWFFIILAVFSFLMFFISINKNKQNLEDQHNGMYEDTRADDFYKWVSILEKDYPNVKHFDLYGTNAAVLWNDSNAEIQVVCITNFSKGIPKTRKYDYFSYNIEESYWTVSPPVGSANMIKEEINKIFI